jgi:phosphomannomutase
MLFVPPRPILYQCPGERYQITRAVHLSRLEAGYAACRDCSHHPDAGMPNSTETSARHPSAPGNRPGLFGQDGIRGAYLNEITPATAGQISSAFASCLWDDWLGQSELADRSLPAVADDSVESEGVTALPIGRPGPQVVLAHDERPSSPDVVRGAGWALRSMGCEVIDIGLATRPCFWFAVDHLRAAGGLFVTGSGCDPSGTGIEFLGTQALPCSLGGMLDRIKQRWQTGFSRPSRCAGSQRTFRPQVAYEAGLLKHFHLLRAVRIVFLCANRTASSLFERLFSKLACRLIPLSAPVRSRALFDPQSADSKAVARAIGEHAAHLGVLVDDDAQRCAFFDERGTLVPPIELATILAAHERSLHPTGGIVIEHGRFERGGAPAATLCRNETGRNERDPAIRVAQALGLSPASLHRADSTLESMSAAMRLHRASFGGGDSGRCWFSESYPACDAVLTVVKLLHVLSQNDRSFSQVIAAG